MAGIEVWSETVAPMSSSFWMSSAERRGPENVGVVRMVRGGRVEGSGTMRRVVDGTVLCTSLALLVSIGGRVGFGFVVAGTGIASRTGAGSGSGSGSGSGFGGSGSGFGGSGSGFSGSASGSSGGTATVNSLSSSSGLRLFLSNETNPVTRMSTTRRQWRTIEATNDRRPRPPSAESAARAAEVPSRIRSRSSSPARFTARPPAPRWPRGSSGLRACARGASRPSRRRASPPRRRGRRA